MDHTIPMDHQLEIDPGLFRQVLGQFPTGVSVVTTTVDEEPAGLTVGSFFSVSLEPPMVRFCVAKTSSTWPLIERTGTFAVSVLADDQVDVCRILATKEPRKFTSVAWSPGSITGAPLIGGALAHIECELETYHPAGDHWIAIGRVCNLNPPSNCRRTFVVLAGRVRPPPDS